MIFLLTDFKHAATVKAWPASTPCDAGGQLLSTALCTGSAFLAHDAVRPTACCDGAHKVCSPRCSAQLLCGGCRPTHTATAASTATAALATCTSRRLQGNSPESNIVSAKASASQKKQQFKQSRRIVVCTAASRNPGGWPVQQYCASVTVRNHNCLAG